MYVLRTNILYKKCSGFTYEPCDIKGSIYVNMKQTSYVDISGACTD